MRIGKLVFGVAMVISTAMAPAQTTQAADLDALMVKLGSKSFKERQDAEQKISAMGAAALAPVTQLAKTTKDPEVRQRAINILTQIESTDVSRASMVSLHFKNASAKDVYLELYRQAHAQLKVTQEGLLDRKFKPITIDVDNVPFWQAMRLLNEQTGLAPMDRHRGLEDQSLDNKMRGEASLSGPYMVVANNDVGKKYSEFTVYVEPRIQAMGYERQPVIEEAFDSSGKACELVPLPGPRMISGPHGNTMQITANWMVGDVAYVKGFVCAKILKHFAKVELKDVLSGKDIDTKVDGVRFVAHVMKPDPGEFKLVMTVYNTNPPLADLGKMTVQLVDSHDTPLACDSTSITDTGSRVEVSTGYKQAGNAGEPVKVVIEYPGENEEVKIPFEFGKRPDEAIAPKDAD